MRFNSDINKQAQEVILFLPYFFKAFLKFFFYYIFLKLFYYITRPPLITIFKCSTRVHLGYGDIIHDQAYNVSFHQKMKSNEYNAKLAIIGAIRRTSREKFYHELCCFYKIFKTHSPKYLFDIIPTAKRVYITRNNDKAPHFKVKHNYFKNSFFPSTVIVWNKLDLKIRNFESQPVSKVTF